MVNHLQIPVFLIFIVDKQILGVKYQANLLLLNYLNHPKLAYFLQKSKAKNYEKMDDFVLFKLIYFTISIINFQQFLLLIFKVVKQINFVFFSFFTIIKHQFLEFIHFYYYHFTIVLNISFLCLILFLTLLNFLVLIAYFLYFLINLARIFIFTFGNWLRVIILLELTRLAFYVLIDVILKSITGITIEIIRSLGQCFSITIF